MIKILFFWISCIGLCVGYELYSILGRVRLSHPYYGPALICRGEERYRIVTLLGIQSIEITPLNPSHRLMHFVGGEFKRTPYEEGVPFTVNEGVLVLQEGARAKIGMIYKTMKTGDSYPMN